MIISSCTGDPTLTNPTNPPGLPCFNPANTGCPSASVQEDEFTLTNVIGYPGCTFKVKLKYCVNSLGSPNATIVTMSQYQLVSYSCPSFGDSIELYYATPSELDENAFFRRFDEAIYTRLENFVFAAHANNVSCSPSNFSGTFTSVVLRASCTSICFYAYEETKDGEIGKRSIPKPTNFVRTLCSTEGCCLRETKICYDPVTDVIIKETSNTMLGGSLSGPAACSGGTMAPPALPNGTILLRCNACTFSCQ